jgi:hypothetical protein
VNLLWRGPGREMMMLYHSTPTPFFLFFAGLWAKKGPGGSAAPEHTKNDCLFFIA